MAVNIIRNNSDAFYRYKMPKLLSKIEGKGNGIKTVIPNMEDIARSLSRPPSYPTKFFGCELGAQVQMDDKTSRYIVNGAHEAARLAELLDSFIKKFVLCPDCGNPETDMSVDKKENIWLDCKACGSHRMVDMHHKLVTFILKNPPNPIPNSSPGKTKKSKEERRREKAEKSKLGSKKTSDEDNDDDYKPSAEDSSATPKTTSPPGETLTPEIAEDDSGLTFTPAIYSGNVDLSTDTNEEFTVDEATLKAARKELEASMKGAVKGLVSEESVEKEETLQGSYDRFAKFLEANPSVDAITAEISRLSLKEEKAAAVVVQVLFTDKILEQLPTKKAILQKLNKSEKSVKGLIGGLERLMGVTYPQLIPKAAKIFKYLYDNDILEEEAILNWFDKPSKKYVENEVGRQIRDVVTPLVEWLKTAEEESDEE